MRVLILGGTGEARQLASVLAEAHPELDVVSSLAGRVRTPALPVGEVRVGGFGGAGGLAGYLRAERVAAVIDATHPFAATITVSASAATAEVGVPLLVLRRPGWTPGPADDWHWVPSLEAAADMLPSLGRRVFLTTGRSGLSAFAQLDDLWFLVRSVDPPEPPTPKRMRTLLARGPFTVPGERAVLREHRIDVLVTKDSGGDMTQAKLRAAGELGIPVVIQSRPAVPTGVPVESTVAGAVRWLTRMVSCRAADSS
jgi:precorrin-6A/cobalt-precorrin-6A reductase